ncbi:unnamed protein product [Durusdinium trenchii]|uniref:Uncharacterized protein n=1 Tax=Durusdinium trenchii TaxID=1381693 RepID=A0ABP0Q1L0_9DINO
MPLSVSDRRTAVRQFVADRHGRPEDKRLDGVRSRSTPSKAPEILRGEEVAERRQAALARVRQRRAERALETKLTSAPASAQTCCSRGAESFASSEEPQLLQPAQLTADVEACSSRPSRSERQSADRLDRSDRSEPIDLSWAALNHNVGVPLKCPEPKVPKTLIVAPSSPSQEGWVPPPRPAMPEMPGIISGPLDALDPPISRKEAFDETMAMLRYPLDPISEGLLKELVLKDLDENTFLLKVILDGKKLDSVGYGKGDGTDRVRYWKKVTVNPAAMSISVVDYVNDGEMGAWITDAKEEVVSTCSVNFLEDPVQIEFCLDKDGERLASPEHRDGMYPWTDAIVANIMSFKNAKVKVRPDAPSIKEKGLKSLVSEPMDEHVSYESFFAQLVTSSREALSSVRAS